MFEEMMFRPHMTPQGIDATIRSRTVRTERSLRSVRVVVMPSVGHFFAASLAAIEEGIHGRYLEHIVVGRM